MHHDCLLTGTLEILLLTYLSTQPHVNMKTHRCNYLEKAQLSLQKITSQHLVPNV